MRNCRRDNSNSRRLPDIRSVGNRYLHSDDARSVAVDDTILVLGSGALLYGANRLGACEVLSD